MKHPLAVLLVALGLVFTFIFFVRQVDPIGVQPPQPAPTDLGDPTTVRQDLRESVVDLLTNICLGGGTITQVCIEGQDATGSNAGMCLPVDCDLTYGIEGERQ